MTAYRTLLQQSIHDIIALGNSSACLEDLSQILGSSELDNLTQLLNEIHSYGQGKPNIVRPFLIHHHTGYQRICLLICSIHALLLKKANVRFLLLDEPDAHLWHKLISTLYYMLMKHNEHNELQILVATHHPAFIDKFPTSEVLLFADDTVKTITDLPPDFTLLQLADLKTSPKVMIVENVSNDQRFIMSVLRSHLGEKDASAIEKAVTFISTGLGRPAYGHVKQLSTNLCKCVPK